MRLVCLLCFSILLLSGCANDTEGEDEADSLLLAAESGDGPRVEQLLAINPATNMRDVCQWTPLMKAALNGHRDIVERLLKHGARVELVDKGGYSALLLAASNNHADIVDLLLQHGADINRVESTRGWTALIWAAKRGHRATVARLLERGADPQIVDRKGRTARAWAEQANQPVTARLLQPAAETLGEGG